MLGKHSTNWSTFPGPQFIFLHNKIYFNSFPWPIYFLHHMLRWFKLCGNVSPDSVSLKELSTQRRLTEKTILVYLYFLRCIEWGMLGIKLQSGLLCFWNFAVKNNPPVVISYPSKTTAAAAPIMLRSFLSARSPSHKTTEDPQAPDHGLLP